MTRSEHESFEPCGQIVAFDSSKDASWRPLYWQGRGANKSCGGGGEISPPHHFSAAMGQIPRSTERISCYYYYCYYYYRQCDLRTVALAVDDCIDVTRQSCIIAHVERVITDRVADDPFQFRVGHRLTDTDTDDADSFSMQPLGLQHRLSLVERRRRCHDNDNLCC